MELSFLSERYCKFLFMSKVVFTSIPMVGRKGMPTKNIHMFLYMRGEELKKQLNISFLVLSSSFTKNSPFYGEIVTNFSSEYISLLQGGVCLKLA